MTDEKVKECACIVRQYCKERTCEECIFYNKLLEGCGFNYLPKYWYYKLPKEDN